MLSMKFIRENVDLVKRKIQERGMIIDIDKLLSIDKKRLQLLSKLEYLRYKKKILSKEIGILLRRKNE